MLKNIIRALRLPFITASILPFAFGSLIDRRGFNPLGFLFGILAVLFTHLSANLINDYSDSKSGADWQDKKFYGFFGGSKLIQEKVFSERFYLNLSIAFALFSLICVIILAKLLNSVFVLLIYCIIILLSWLYSHGPFRFSYHMLGEFFIFILFGPISVMGGYFIQTGIFPDTKSFLLSLPFGFFTTAILFANEVPDFLQDKQVNKNTWVNILGPKYSFIIYYILILSGFISISLNIYFGFLGLISLLSFFLLFPAVRATNILRKHYSDKLKLVESSRLSIAVQTLSGIVLIFSLKL